MSIFTYLNVDREEELIKFLDQELHDVIVLSKNIKEDTSNKFLMHYSKSLFLIENIDHVVTLN